MKKILLHPLFIVGLLVRLVIIFSVQPIVSHDWYVPFIENSIHHFSLDPWQTHLANGGSPLAFPYGYAMWICLMPVSAFAFLLGIPVSIGYPLSLLVFDFLLFLILIKTYDFKSPDSLWFFWLSPIVIFGNYWFGINDIIPVVILCLAIYQLKKIKMFWVGFLLLTAISAKASMVIALPFFIIYMIHRFNDRVYIQNFLAGFFSALVLFMVPFLLSADGIAMLSQNPELRKVYELKISMGRESSVYLLPMLYLFLLYVIWRAKRSNFSLFISLMGISFFCVILMTPASPGWFIWVVPFLFVYMKDGDKMTFYGVYLFAFLWLIHGMNVLPNPSSDLITSVTQLAFTLLETKKLFIVKDLILTAMTMLGVLIAARMWRDKIQTNVFYANSRNTLLLGIGGDSGSGKDTLSEALTKMFGPKSTAYVSGDDYHLWDRHKPMWQVMTHLNPSANNISLFNQNILALAAGKDVSVRYYDHNIGKMSKPFTLQSKDFIIASGLHALYSKDLLEKYDLSIYLDINEDLRKQLKLNRDVSMRGHQMEKVLWDLQKREPDSVKYIRPQKENANLVLSLKADAGRKISSEKLNYYLTAEIKWNIDIVNLNKKLIALCGIRIEQVSQETNGHAILLFEGSLEEKDVEACANALYPDAIEYFDYTPEWKHGMLGLMQLIVLAHIDFILFRKHRK